MPTYEVLRDCATGRTGQLHKGDDVDLDAETADWLNSQIKDAVRAKHARARAKKDDDQS